MGKGFECQSVQENPPLLKGLSLDVTSSYKDQRNFPGEIPWTMVKILGIEIMRSLSQQHSCNLGAYKLMLGGKILHVWPLKALARNVYFQEVWFVHCLSLAYEEEIELNAHNWLSELQSMGRNMAANGMKWVTQVKEGNGWQEPGCLHWDGEDFGLDSVGSEKLLMAEILSSKVKEI